MHVCVHVWLLQTALPPARDRFSLTVQAVQSVKSHLLSLAVCRGSNYFVHSKVLAGLVAAALYSCRLRLLTFRQAGCKC